MHLSPRDIVITPSSHPTPYSPRIPSTLDHLTNTDHKLEGLSTSARTVEDLSAGELRMISHELTQYRSRVVHGEHVSNLGEILSVSLLDHFLLKTLGNDDCTQPPTIVSFWTLSQRFHFRGYLSFFQQTEETKDYCQFDMDSKSSSSSPNIFLWSRLDGLY